VLLVQSDSSERRELTRALRRAGVPVRDVSSIAEIERWPTGDIVVTEAQRFTPWWKTVGATHIVVIVNTPEEGASVWERGATAWIDRHADPDSLVAMIRSFLGTDEMRDAV
jgi:hypothetical protein